MNIYQVSLNPQSIARVLATIAFVLVLASIGGQLTVYMTAEESPDHELIVKLARRVYVDAEQNIPNFFSTMLLAFSAVLLSVIALLKRKEKDSQAKYWTVLSVGFLCMAADEAASIHEMLIMPMRSLMGGHNLGIFYWAWVIPGIGLVLVLGVFFLKFLVRLNAKTRRNFLTAAALYLGGAIGFEMIGGWYGESHGIYNLPYSMISTVEESLEMAGAIVFIRALLVYIAETYKEVQIRLNTSWGR
jgi:hypothetical protein